MDSYGNSFSSLSDLSHMFASPDHHNNNDAPPTSISLFDDPPQGCTVRTGGIVTNKERERRGKMANMYSILQTLLPTLASNKQASREKIVTEAIDFIKLLEADKVRLEQKLMMKRNVDVAKLTDVTVATSSRAVVAFEIKCRFRKMKTTTKMMMSLIEVFEKYAAEILSLSVVVADDEESTMMVAVTAAIVDGDGQRNGVVVDVIKRELLLLASQI